MSSKTAHKMQPTFQICSQCACCFLKLHYLSIVRWSRPAVCKELRGARKNNWMGASSDRGSGSLQIGVLDSKPAFCILAVPQDLAQSHLLANEHQWMRQNFWVVIQQVWFLFKALLSVFFVIKSEYKPARDIFLKAICTFCHVCAPEFLPLAETLQSDILLTFPGFACHFFSKLHLDFRLPIKLESRFSSKNLQCEHIVRGDLIGPF